MSSTDTRPLLVVDGDSLAHRAYHALPKSFRRAEGRPGNALLGFSNFMLRLWQSEQPRAVLVGWDSLDTPTYRHELFAGYQAGRDLHPTAPCRPRHVHRAAQPAAGSADGERWNGTRPGGPPPACRRR